MRNIKIFISVILVINILINITACNEKDSDIDDSDKYITFTAVEYDLTYDVPDRLEEFAIDDDGALYYVSQKSEYFESGDVFVESKLIAEDLSGNKIKEIEISYPLYESMCVKNGIVYYATCYALIGEEVNNNKLQICTLDSSTGEEDVLCTLDDFVSMKDMFIIENTLYFIGVNKVATARDYELYNLTDEFLYYGEVISSVNIETGEMNDIFTELPISFSKTVDNNIMIYAYDEKGGYFFQKYNIESGNYGEKTYRTIKTLRNYETDFIITEQDKQIIFINVNKLKISGLNEIVVTEIANNAIKQSNKVMIYKSGFLFYRTEEGDIRRILLNRFFRSPTTLNMGYTDKFVAFPENYGYFINQKELNYDEFALSVLAGDNKIDFYLIDSRHDFAKNIRSKGAYYALNEVPEAMNYLNATFPYVKEAALTNNNDIWMIPVSVNTYVAEYNQKVGERYGFDIGSVKTLNNLIDTIYSYNEKNIDESYWLNSYPILEKYFYQLIKKNTGFNKDEFKKMAEYSYDKLNYVKNSKQGALYTVLANRTSKADVDSNLGGLFNAYFYDGIFASGGFYGLNASVLEFVSKSTDYDDYNKAKSDTDRTHFTVSNYTNIRYASLPNIEGMNKNDVTCEFFYVNPNSKNLDLVLEYISEYCKETMNKRNTFILQDKSTYDDRVYINDFYDIYNSDSYVRFGLSDELFFEDFVKYLGDEITLDEYLNRVEYKINAYLNE